MNTIDIVLVAFILIITVIGALRGFLKSLFNVIAYVLAALTAKLVSIPVTQYIYTNYISAKVLDTLYEIMPSGSVDGEIMTVIDNVLDSLPSFVSTLASQFGIFDSVKPSGGVASSLSVEVIESDYIGPIILSVLSIIVLVLLFILFAAIFRIIFIFVDKAITDDSHKIVKSVNIALGAVFGLIKSLLPAGLICIVLNIIAPLINNSSLYSLVNDSFFCGIIAGMFN